MLKKVLVDDDPPCNNNKKTNSIDKNIIDLLSDVMGCMNF